MSATGQANAITQRKVYTNGQAADTTSWKAGGFMADWALFEGPGTTILVDESGNSVSIVTDGTMPTKSIPGPWQSFTSTTAVRCTMGNGGLPPTVQLPTTAVPATSAALGGVQLLGGLSGGGTAGQPILNVGPGNVSGILPASNAQDFVDSGTVVGTSFTATVNFLNQYNMIAAVVGTITFPPITATNAGLTVALINNGTGATVTTLQGSGTATIGVPGGTASGTIAGPNSHSAIRYTASQTLNAWIPAI